MLALYKILSKNTDEQHPISMHEMAEKKVEVIMEGLLEKNPVPKKETDVMAWVRHMNMLKVKGEAMVREVIYT